MKKPKKINPTTKSDPQQSHVNCFNLKKKPDSSESDIEQKKQDMPLNMGLDPLSSLNSQTGSPKTDDTLRITHETTVKLSFKSFSFQEELAVFLLKPFHRKSAVAGNLFDG